MREDPKLRPGPLPGGHRLFANYQCRGCHRLGGEGGEVGPALDAVASRLRPDFLYAFLRDPERIVPDSPMKELDLWDPEAEAIARYLLAETR